MLHIALTNDYSIHKKANQHNRPNGYHDIRAIFENQITEMNKFHYTNVEIA